jgi:hypothetical protein
MHGGAPVSAGLLGGGSDRYLRWILAAVAASDVVSLAVVAHQARLGAGLRGSPTSGLAAALASLPGLVLIAGCSLVALALFASRRASIVTGLVALAGLAALEHTQAAFFLGGHQRSYFSGGAALAGWIFGLVFASQMRSRGVARSAFPGEDEMLGEAGAVAGLAATYVDASLSKLMRKGILWIDATTLRSAILTNHDIDDSSPLAALGRFVVENDWVARALSLSTLAIQLGAIVYVLGPRARIVWGTMLLAFHVNVALLTGIVYLKACILLLAFSYPWQRLRSKSLVPENTFSADEVPARTRHAAHRIGAWVAVAVAVAWLARGAGLVGQ